MCSNRSHLGEDKIFKLLLKFSMPTFTGMLINALYNVVDRIFIGNGVGPLGIAGVTIGFPVMLAIMAFTMLIGAGAASLISIKLGEHNEREAETILGNGIVLLILVSVIISGIGLTFLNPLLKLFGASNTVLPYARDYMHIFLWGTVFMSTSFGMSYFIRAEGKPTIAMYAMFIGAASNIILNPIFIFGLGWGVRGAALATVISCTFSTAWTINYYLSPRSHLKIRLRNLKIRLPTVRAILVLGAAPFIMQIASSLLNVTMNHSLSYYGGDMAVAGMGIVISVLTLMRMPVIGISQGAQPIIGYNYGAEQFERVKEVLKLSILLTTLILSVSFIVIQVFSQQIIFLFNQEDKELLHFGTHALRTFLFFLPISGIQVVSANYFQAVRKPKQAMFLSLSRQVLIVLPLILILPAFYGLEGILYAGPAADLSSTLITVVLLYMEVKNLKNKTQV